MWLLIALVAILVFLLLVVIMDTSMKLALMITTLYNYDTKKLFIPAVLTVILWGILIFGCFNTITNALGDNAIDMIFSMIFDRTLIQGYESVFIKAFLSAFIVGTILQSFTYYTVNINYQVITGTVRFSVKKVAKKLFSKVFNKENTPKHSTSALSEVEIGPKKLTFPRAIITSVISVIITALVCIGLFFIGNMLSGKVLTLF